MTSLFPDFSLETRYGGCVAGVDEVGRGPWAGPVITAAAILPQGYNLAGINDSKKLTAGRREQLYAMLCQDCIYAIGEASVAEIDELNILRATMLAMQRAVAALPTSPDTVLVDGNRCPALPCNAHSVIKGDSISLSIAAASIIAKVTRDRMMAELAQDHPHYGWETNAGYGTKTHQDGLKTHGITAHHRRSFKPIQAYIQAREASYA